MIDRKDVLVKIEEIGVKAVTIVVVIERKAVNMQGVVVAVGVDEAQMIVTREAVVVNMESLMDQKVLQNQLNEEIQHTQLDINRKDLEITSPVRPIGKILHHASSDSNLDVVGVRVLEVVADVVEVVELVPVVNREEHQQVNEMTMPVRKKTTRVKDTTQLTKMKSLPLQKKKKRETGCLLYTSPSPRDRG